MKTRLARLLFSFWFVSFAGLAGMAAGDEVRTISLEEIRPGQTGTVWTVFQGTEPEPFQVEVVGVLRNALGPKRSLIICKLTDPRVQKMGAVAGMSGSPLYIGGRYAGALSYQLQRFETVRHAGFTPVADLLSVTERPLSNAPHKFAEGGPEPVATPLAIAGLSADVTGIFKQQWEELGLTLAPVGGSSNGTLAKEARLRPGSAIAVALATGDVSIAATGTVSWVDGNRIIAFGHPMLSLGETRLPLAYAEIVTILPSLQNSFKIANAGQVIGTLTQDRLSAISGEIGPIPEMIPVTITAPERTLRFKVVKQEKLTPVICAASVMQAVRGSNKHGQLEGLKMATIITYPDAPPLRLESWFGGQDSLQGASTQLLARLALPMQGPFRGLLPTAIEISIERVTDDATLTLDTVRPSTNQPLAGETITISLAARGAGGEAPEATVQIPIPSDWVGRKLDLVVTNGPTLDRLSGRPDSVLASQIRDVASFVAWQNDNRREDGLYVSVVERSDGLLDEVDLLRQAPGSTERIARRADEARFAKREIFAPLWTQHVFAGHLVEALVRRPFTVTE